ncbi:type II toxin-antitoxin system RelE/ParE family toxin [Bacteroidota bacterium]
MENYRIRVGNYRILYEINDNDKAVDIYEILHRKDVYKKK